MVFIVFQFQHGKGLSSFTGKKVNPHVIFFIGITNFQRLVIYLKNI